VQGKNYNFDFLDFLPHDVTCSIPGRLLQCPPQRVAQQLAVANYVSQAIPKLASGTLGPLPTPPAATPGGSASPASSSSNPQIAEQIKKVIANYETSTFHSPLDDQQLLQLVIAESETAGVPLWLLFGQAKVETTFGSPKNVTTRDGVSFTDGSLGNAHNLFNIRPGTTWKGKVVVSPIDGPFRAYGSYEDGVRDYVRLMSGDPYKGKTLEAVINTYFTASDNSTAKVDDYITSLIQFAGVLGVTVNRNTIPVP